ncbi:MAG: type I DNA topoisomerase [Chloroflexota bacterium]
MSTPTPKRPANDLVIVESPAKARTIERYLGPGYQVVASFGHVRDLPKRRLGVDVEGDFAVEYVPLTDRRKELDRLTELARKADHVWLATDLDREGEAIAWHIAQHAGLSDERIRRVTFSEITKSAIDAAFEHPRALNLDLINAQQARRVIDRLVGYKLSPLVASKIRRGLTAGRVQSVAVRLVVDRERQISAFVAEEYWSIAATLQRQSGGATFVAQLTRIDGEKAVVSSQQQAEEHEAALRAAAYRVASVTRSERKRSASPPFTTSTLQQEASRKLSFSAKRTMSVAQRLYEGVRLSDGQAGLITYMRTDSVAIAASAVAEARELIGQRYGADFVPSRPNTYRARSKGAQEAHEAIRPSSFSRTPASVQGHLKPEEYRLYELIWQRAVASQMAPARFDQVGVDVEAGRYTLHVGASKRIFDGYQAVYVEGRDEEEDERLAILPELTDGEPLGLNDLESEQHFTQPPPRFTEASLIKELEEHGIGRPSTYAPTVSTIRDRGYVEVKERRLFPQESAFRVTDMLVEHFPNIVDYEFTAKMEGELDDVARGEHEWIPMVRDFYGPFAAKVIEGKATIEKQIEVTDIPCPLTGDKGDMLIKRFGRNGWFLGCAGYPECKYTQPLPGEEGDESQLEGVGETCPQCGEGKLAAKRGRFGPFVGCDRYPDCRYIKKDGPPPEQFGTCPQCNQGTVVSKRTRRGRTFYACDRYPDCDYATSHRPGTEVPADGEAAAGAEVAAGGEAAVVAAASRRPAGSGTPRRAAGKRRASTRRTPRSG